MERLSNGASIDDTLPNQRLKLTPRDRLRNESFFFCAAQLSRDSLAGRQLKRHNGLTRWTSTIPNLLKRSRKQGLLWHPGSLRARPLPALARCCEWCSKAFAICRKLTRTAS